MAAPAAGGKGGGNRPRMGTTMGSMVRTGICRENARRGNGVPDPRSLIAQQHNVAGLPIAQLIKKMKNGYYYVFILFFFLLAI